MTTIDNPNVSPEQAKQWIEDRIKEVAAKLEGAEDRADAAGEILRNPAFEEVTRRIMEQTSGDFFNSALVDKAKRNRAYALNMMHALYVAELARMVNEPAALEADLSALQTRYDQIDELL